MLDLLYVYDESTVRMGCVRSSSIILFILRFSAVIVFPKMHFNKFLSISAEIPLKIGNPEYPFPIRTSNSRPVKYIHA